MAHEITPEEPDSLRVTVRIPSLFKLTPEAQARAAEYRDWCQERRAVFETLTNENLVATAQLYMAQMTPMHFAPGEPVYDATMWHIILPELMRRLE